MNAQDELLHRAVARFSEHGIGDTNMRRLAAELGASGRMLHYHLGSREALLAAVVVERVERGEQAVLAAYLADTDDPLEAGARFWPHVAETARTFAPLFFELSAHAMHRRDYAEPLRRWLATGWVDAAGREALTETFPRKRQRYIARSASRSTQQVDNSMFVKAVDDLDLGGRRAGRIPAGLIEVPPSALCAPVRGPELATRSALAGWVPASRTKPTFSPRFSSIPRRISPPAAALIRGSACWPASLIISAI